MINKKMHTCKKPEKFIVIQRKEIAKVFVFKGKKDTENPESYSIPATVKGYFKTRFCLTENIINSHCHRVILFDIIIK